MLKHAKNEAHPYLRGKLDVAFLAFFTTLSTLCSIIQQIHDMVFWIDIRNEQFANMKANPGSPVLVLANGSVGMDLALFYIRTQPDIKNQNHLASGPLLTKSWQSFTAIPRRHYSSYSGTPLLQLELLCCGQSDLEVGRWPSCNTFISLQRYRGYGNPSR
jgi:hypothetical protein